MGLGNVARQFREGSDDKGAAPAPAPAPEVLTERYDRALKLATTLVSIDEQIKKLSALKSETATELLPLIKLVGDPTSKRSQDRKMLVLTGGTKILIGKTGGSKRPTKTLIVQKFGDAGTLFWDELPAGPVAEILSIKGPLDLGPDPEAE